MVVDAASGAISRATSPVAAVVAVGVGLDDKGEGREEPELGEARGAAPVVCAAGAA